MDARHRPRPRRAKRQGGRRGAERINRDTNRRYPEALDVLAAAYAETGQFDEAVATADEALKLAQKQNNQDMVKSSNQMIELFRKGEPFRKPRQGAAAEHAPKTPPKK